MSPTSALRNTCGSAKVQGAFIAAPAWIGVTLLLQNDHVAAWLWMNLVVTCCILAVLGLLGWLTHRLLSKETPSARNDRLPRSRMARQRLRRTGRRGLARQRPPSQG